VNLKQYHNQGEMSKGSDDALDDLCKVTPKLVDEATELVATLELVTETKRALCNLLVQVFEFVVISENLENRAVSVQQRQKSHRLSTQLVVHLTTRYMYDRSGTRNRQRQ
jgi:hypothetical protein